LVSLDKLFWAFVMHDRTEKSWVSLDTLVSKVDGHQMAAD